MQVDHLFRTPVNSFCSLFPLGDLLTRIVECFLASILIANWLELPDRTLQTLPLMEGDLIIFSAIIEGDLLILLLEGEGLICKALCHLFMDELLLLVSLPSGDTSLWEEELSGEAKVKLKTGMLVVLGDGIRRLE